VNPDPTAESSPLLAEIAALLRSLRKRIRGRLLWHGAGVCLAALLGATIAYYAADRTLVLPAPLRLLLTAAGTVGMAWLAWQYLVRPYRLDLSDPDVAITLEARFPNLRERLISAVQLGRVIQGGDPRNQSREMIARVVADATAAARTLTPAEVLTWRHAGRAWAAFALALLVALPGAIARSDSVAVFIRRALGANVPYPRLTTLHVELPASNEQYRIERTEDRATVTMAAGDDLPVLVRAEGVVPREVMLAIEGGRGMPAEVATAARPNGRFRHVFRRVTDGFRFHARGGDDDRGDLLVEVVTIRPPRVGTIRAALTYPEYTGKPPVVQEGGSIEAIEGSHVALEVLPLGEVASGRLQFQETGEVLELEQREVEDDGGRRTVLSGSFTVRKNDRYQVQLAGREGLRGPQAASYPIIVVPDAPPGGQLLWPQDDGLNVLIPGAILPLRAQVKDDFAVAEVVAELTVGDRSEPVRRTLALPAGRTSAAVTELIPLRGLLGPDATVKEGDSITLAVHVTDNRAPEPQTTKLPSRTLHVVELGDMERRIAGHFRRVRAEVEKALELQIDRRERLGALLGDREGAPAAELAAALTALQVGQGRIQSMAGRIHAELMRSFNLHLFNPIDEGAQAQPAIELFAARHADPDDGRALVAEYYRDLAAQRESGRIGPLGKFLDRILAMTVAADETAEKRAPGCSQQLAGARGDSAQLDGRLRTAHELQGRIVEVFEGLLAKLDEWNDFQDVISTTRALRDSQRDVQARTRSIRGK